MNKLTASVVTALVIGLGQLGLVEQARAETAWLVNCRQSVSPRGIYYVGTYRTSSGQTFQVPFYDGYCPQSIDA